MCTQRTDSTITAGLMAKGVDATFISCSGKILPARGIQTSDYQQDPHTFRGFGVSGRGFYPRTNPAHHGQSLIRFALQADVRLGAWLPCEVRSVYGSVAATPRTRSQGFSRCSQLRAGWGCGIRRCSRLLSRSSRPVHALKYC
jgi:hypothetical protein